MGLEIVILATSLLGWGFAPPGAAQSSAPGAPAGPSIEPLPPSTLTEVDADIKNFDYSQLASAVDAMPPSAERDYFAGVLANRSGHIAQSIELLTHALPHLESSEPYRASVALRALAHDYLKSYRYNDAIQASEELLHKFSSQLDKVESHDAREDYRALLLLRDARPQTITFEGGTDLPILHNPGIGGFEAGLAVNGVQQNWILDTGANFSTVSASFASRLGVRLSRNVAEVQGTTGAESPIYIAMLPEMQVGGATLHNVVLLVLNDDSLNASIGRKKRYQINAILGYPVLQALRRVTFTQYGHFLAGPDSPPGKNGARLYMDGLMPLLECTVGNRKILLAFNSGADSTLLSIRFHRDFPEAFHGLKGKSYEVAGAGGMKEMKAHYLPDLHLEVGEAHAVLHKVAVVPEMGTDLDGRYGSLGRDLVDAYRSFTIDFETMRFSLGDEITPPPK